MLHAQENFKILKEKHNFQPVLKNISLFPGMQNSRSPEYIDGKKGLDKYVSENIVIPGEVNSKNLKGTVVLSYIIDSKGAIKTIQVISSTPDLLNKPVIEILKKSGPWIPGTKNGKYISMNMEISYVY